jgi:hypothetical protein
MAGLGRGHAGHQPRRRAPHNRPAGTHRRLTTEHPMNMPRGISPGCYIRCYTTAEGEKIRLE